VRLWHEVVGFAILGLHALDVCVEVILARDFDKFRKLVHALPAGQVLKQVLPRGADVPVHRPIFGPRFDEPIISQQIMYNLRIPIRHFIIIPKVPRLRSAFGQRPNARSKLQSPFLFLSNQSFNGLYIWSMNL
jgi:hypothetical protein